MTASENRVLAAVPTPAGEALLNPSNHTPYCFPRHVAAKLTALRSLASRHTAASRTAKRDPVEDLGVWEAAEEPSPGEWERPKRRSRRPAYIPRTPDLVS